MLSSGAVSVAQWCCEAGVAIFGDADLAGMRLAEHPAVVPPLLASVAAVLTSVHAAIDAVRDDSGGSDDGRGPRDRPADYASSPYTGWPKRHLRLLP